MLINVKMPTIVGILTFKSRINFVLSLVEYVKSFITSGPELCIFFIGRSLQDDSTHSVGTKSQILSSVAPPGRKSWLLFSVRDMSGGLGNPCFTKFSVVNFL